MRNSSFAERRDDVLDATRRRRRTRRERDLELVLAQRRQLTSARPYLSMRSWMTLIVFDDQLVAVSASMRSSCWARSRSSEKRSVVPPLEVLAEAYAQPRKARSSSAVTTTIRSEATRRLVCSTRIRSPCRPPPSGVTRGCPSRPGARGGTRAARGSRPAVGLSGAAAADRGSTSKRRRGASASERAHAGTGSASGASTARAVEPLEGGHGERARGLREADATTPGGRPPTPAASEGQQAGQERHGRDQSRPRCATERGLRSVTSRSCSRLRPSSSRRSQTCQTAWRD